MTSKEDKIIEKIEENIKIKEEEILYFNMIDEVDKVEYKEKNEQLRNNIYKKIMEISKNRK
tara:strand:+ start:665 stop:847 length:183 start_codon:yes stop_codon:yes gene_type:complete